MGQRAGSQLINEVTKDNLLPHEEEVLHNFAFQSYQDKRYVEAESAYRMLAMFRTNNASYWLGLGSSLFMQERYLEALHPLEIATVQNRRDLRATILTIEILIKTGQQSQAEKLIVNTLQSGEIIPKEWYNRLFELQAYVEKEHLHVDTIS